MGKDKQAPRVRPSAARVKELERQLNEVTAANQQLIHEKLQAQQPPVGMPADTCGPATTVGYGVNQLQRDETPAVKLARQIDDAINEMAQADDEVQHLERRLANARIHQQAARLRHSEKLREFERATHARIML